MSSWGSKDANVHIANALAEDLYVLVTPNPDWVWADLAAVLVTTLVSEVASGGAATGAAAAEVSSFTRALKSAESILAEIGELQRLRKFKHLEEVRKVWETLEKMKEVYEAVSEAYEAAKTFTGALPSDDDMNSWQNQITAFFHDKVKIGAGEAENVADEDFLEPWRALEPSYWGAISGASTVHVLLVSESLGLCAGFNTDPDHSWIATPQGVVRAHYGSLWTPDPGAGVHHWNGRSAPAFLATQEIKPVSPLRSSNGRFRLALHRNGDLVVEDGRFHDLVWRSNTAGCGATRALFRWDGRLALLTEGGDVVWESPFNPPPLDRGGYSSEHEFARRASRLELRDDGEIIVRCATVAYTSDASANFWQRPERELSSWGVRLSPEYVVWRSAVCRAPQTFMDAAHPHLRLGDELQSMNLQYRLMFQSDGELALVSSDGVLLWNAGTANSCASEVRFDDDGRLAVRTITGEVLWSNEGGGFVVNPQTTGARLRLQDDGNLVVYTRDEHPIWDRMNHPSTVVAVVRNEPQPPRLIVAPSQDPSGLPIPPSVRADFERMARERYEAARRAYESDHAAWQLERDRLAPQPVRANNPWMKMNEFLPRESSLSSRNRQYAFTYRASGELALTRGAEVVWKTDPHADPGRLLLQDDGNLVAYDGAGRPQWSSAAHGGKCGPAYAGCMLVAQDNGDLVIRTPRGVEVWSAKAAAAADAQEAARAHEATRRALEAAEAPPTAVGSLLFRGQQLLPGQCLMSPSGRYRLEYRLSGGLVLRDARADAELWRAPYVCDAAHRVWLRDDANLVVESSPGSVCWDTARDGGVVGEGGMGVTFVVEDYGAVVVRAESGRALWHRGNAAPPSNEPVCVGTALEPGAHLAPNQYIRSEARLFWLLYQNDGNLVVYRKDGSDAVPWRSDTVGQPAWRLELQAEDGDLVMYSEPGKVIWRASRIRGRFGADTRQSRLIITDDGNLNIVTPTGALVWCSDESLLPRAPAPPPPPPPPPPEPPPPPAVSLGASLAAGQPLERGQWLQSENGRFKLRRSEFDRDLVIVEGDRAEGDRIVWRGGLGFAPWRVALQPDGDLCAQEQDGTTRWRSSQNGGRVAPQGGCSALLRDDGALVILGPDRSYLWSSAPALTGDASVLGDKADEILPGQCLRSVNGQFTLTYQWDGDLVLSGGAAAPWRSGTAGSPTGRVRVQPDGSLAVLTPGGAALWSSNEHGGRSGPQFAGGHLWLTDEGKVFLETRDRGLLLWCSDPEELPVPMSLGAVLRAGQHIAKGQWLLSSNGRYRLLYADNGGLVLHRFDDGRAVELWTAGIFGRAAWRVVLGDDGELVVRDTRATVAWRSNEHGGSSGAQHAGSALELQNDGALVLRGPDGAVLWSNDPQLIPRPVNVLGTRLPMGRRLESNERLRSENGRFTLAFQPDGNLATTRDDGAVVWETGLRGAGASALLNQHRLFHRTGEGVWSSEDHGGRGPSSSEFELELRNDGALVIGSPYNRALPWVWSSDLDLLAPLPRNVGATLRAGEAMGVGQRMGSENGAYTFFLEDNLLRINNNQGACVWSLRYTDDTTTNRSPWRLTLQDDGDLVVLAAPGAAVWRASDHGGKRGARYAGGALSFQDDGTLAVRAPDGEVVWAANDPPPALCVGGAMLPVVQGGPWLAPGQWLQSNNGKYRLTYRPDGNLVLTGKSDRVLWESGTTGRPGWRVVLQNNGNLTVLASKGGASLWSSTAHGGGTYNFGVLGLIVRDDGNVALRGGSDADILWQTHTATIPSELTPGESLRCGSSLASPDGKVRLDHTDNGNVILHRANQQLWQSSTFGPTQVYVANGVLTVSNAARNWQSPAPDPQRVARYAEAHLEVRDDGNLALVTPDARVVWSTDTYCWDPPAVPGPLPAGCLGDTLRAGQSLDQEHFLQSPSGIYRAIYRGDGRLAVYHCGGSAQWQTDNAVTDSHRVAVRDDGTLAVFRAAGTAPVWVSDHQPYGDLHGPQYAGAALTLCDNGTLVLTAPDGTLLWGAPQHLVPPRICLGSARSSDRGMIGRGQWLQSPDGAHKLTLRLDGNLVLTRRDGTIVWQANTAGVGVERMMVDAYGRISLANPFREVWAHPATIDAVRTHTLSVTNDGALVMSDDRENITWRLP